MTMRRSSTLFIIAAIAVLCTVVATTTVSARETPSVQTEAKEMIEWFTQRSHFGKWLPKKTLHKEHVPLAKAKQGASLVPVVIVPSFFGNTLYASLSNAHPGHFYCHSNSKEFVIFFDEERFIPPFINCFLSDLTLDYQNHEYIEPTGVTIDSQYEYGNTTTLEYVDPTSHKFGIWNATVEALVGSGYVRGVSVRGAPADWRLGPNGWAPFWSRLKDLIEETSVMNGNQPVAVTGLSMGGPYFMGFLNSFVNQTWKEQYIHSFTSMSGVYGGSSAAIGALTGGDNGFVPKGINPKSYDGLAQSIGAVVSLLPSPQFFPDEVLVSTVPKNYTAADFVELLYDAGANISAEMLIDMEAFRSFEAPGVPLHCIIGYNLSTIATMDYVDKLGGNFTIGYGDGDGVVLTQSLDVCDGWASNQTQPINTIRIPNLQHGDPQFEPSVIKYFLTTVLGMDLVTSE